MSVLTLCQVLFLSNVYLSINILVLLILFMTLIWHVRGPCFVTVLAIELEQLIVQCSSVM